ncbi:MAG: sulfatase [Planctomycetes bacterium]|nr:sulfatase [Planctomycetota bacterium]
MFLVDDLGWQDTSVPFSSEETPLNRRYRTPNMKRMAADGMRFTQAYACCVCTPTRVSLMTGLNAARHRVTNWTLRNGTHSVNDEGKHPMLEFPQWNFNGLTQTPGEKYTVYATALPELLHQAGYRTIHVGKAHFGALDTSGADPLNLGFDINIAGHAAGAPASYLGTEAFGNLHKSKKKPWAVPGLEKYHGQEIFLTEALTREANLAVDQAVEARQPFFLYMAHYAVHTPLNTDARFIQPYLDAGLDRREAMYAAMIEGVDQSLGDIMKNVERHGLTSNTVILFMSDNGGLSAVARGGEPHTHNRPLASGKGSAYEGGIRVPMLVKWPGVTAPASTCDTPVIIEDFFATILEIAGAAGLASRDVDGKSFVPLLTGNNKVADKEEGSSEDRPLFWHYPNWWGPNGPGIGPSSTIRKGDWKLIYFHLDQHYELYNLAEDLSEKNNQAQERPTLTNELANVLGDYLRDVQAQMPSIKATGKQVPWPGEDYLE